MAKLKFGDASSVFLGLKAKQGVAPDPEMTDEDEQKLAQVAESSSLITTQLRTQEKQGEQPAITAVSPPQPAQQQVAEAEIPVVTEELDLIPPHRSQTRRSAKPVVKVVEIAPEPEKVVKDSYSMPPADYDLLIAMEHICMRNLRKAPRSVLLRLGLRLLSAKSEKELLHLVDGILAEGKGCRKG